MKQTSENKPQHRKWSSALLAIGLAGISVFMYAYTWIKDWN